MKYCLLDFDEYILLKIISFLNYEELSKINLISKNVNYVYKKYRDSLWEDILINNKFITYLLHNESCTLRLNYNAFSFHNKMDKQDMFYKFLRSMKIKNILLL